MTWWQRLRNRRVLDDTLEAELRDHVKRQVADSVASGMSAEHARRAARLQLGGLDQVKEACRDARGTRWVESLVQDGRYALRVLRQHPGSTLTAILTLAIGIGLNTAMFSVMNGVLLKPLPYADADRILLVTERSPRGDLSPVSTLDYLDWARENDVFEAIAAGEVGSLTLGGPTPVQLRSLSVTADYSDVFGIHPVIGRLFSPDDQVPGRSHVALLGHAVWTSQFGADPGVIGRVIRLRGEPFTVVGVLPEGGTADWSYTEVWVPLIFEPDTLNRTYRSLTVYAKLKPVIPIESALADLTALEARLAQTYPASNKGWSVAIVPYAEWLVSKPLRQSLYVLFAAVVVVLLIGCVNLAGIALARGAAREREVAIRVALGGGRGRLIQQFLTEHVVLSCGGGLAGLGVGYVTMAVLRAWLPAYGTPGQIPPAATVTLDGRVLAFTLAISIGSGVLFGLAPALNATRPDLAGAIKEGGGHGASSNRHFALRRGFVMAEVALAFVLLASAGLLVRSLISLQQVSTGFNPANVVTALVPLSANDAFKAPVERNRYLHEILTKVQSVPGVHDAALTSVLPLQGWGSEVPFRTDGEAATDPATRPSAFFKMISPSYFDAIGLPLRRGRQLTDHDVPGAPFVAVINETMARMYLSDGDPIGRRLLIPELVQVGRVRFGPEIAWEIVGVVADERVLGLDKTKDSPGVYVSIDQSATRHPALVVRSAAHVSGLDASIRRAVAFVNQDQPLFDVKTLDQLMAASTGTEQQRSLLLTLFAFTALLLTAVGIYGVVSYAVVSRTRELGIRAALGASRSRLLGLILRDGLAMTAIGLAVGAAGAFATGRLLSSLVFGIDPRDPVTMLIAMGLLAGVAGVACYVPARRATRISPLIALRSE